MQDIVVKNLTWDSDFFKIKVGSIDITNLNSIEINEALNQAQNSHYRLLYLLDKEYSRTTKKLLGLRKGCKLVDTKIVFYKVLTDVHIINEDCRELFSSDDLDRVYYLGLESGQYSRYKLDLNFNYDDFERLYRIWIDNSISGQIADKFIVYELRDKIIGFVTLQFKDKQSQIGLIAVAPEARGLCVGTKLIAFAEGLSVKNGCTNMVVATQEINHQACNFYKKLNMTIKEKTNIYHLWIQ